MKCFLKTGFLALYVIPGILCAIEPQIKISFPSAGASVATVGHTYVTGSVIPPDTPLTVNGQTVTPWRTGSFLYVAAVVPGTNTLVFRAGATMLAHTFTVPFAAASWNGKDVSVLQPLKPMGVYTGERVRLACRAPGGLAVRAAVGERTVALAPQENDSTRYSGLVSFAAPAQKVPVVFFADGLADVSAADLTACAEWPAYRVNGPLFETRARSIPGDGDTVAFLPPGFHVQGAGFEGFHTRIWLEGKQRYVATDWLAPSALKSPPPRAQAIPDIASGYGPHPPTNRTPTQMLIVLDPGHGGTATGAIGPSGLTEKEVNLKQAKLIKSVLVQAGFRVLMTRETDVALDLYERARIAYREKADAFISIHHNATAPMTNPQDVRHVATYAWNDIGLQLARAIHPHIAATTPITDCGVKVSSFAVCRNPAVPSCLLELDFINCPEGEESIQRPDQQRRVAEAILAGLRDWLSRPSL